MIATVEDDGGHARLMVCRVESGPSPELGLVDFPMEKGMPRQRFTSEQIIGKLREGEVFVAKGGTAIAASTACWTPAGPSACLSSSGSGGGRISRYQGNSPGGAGCG